MEELDANWIEDFEETDKPYAQFYKGDLSEINLFFLYSGSSVKQLTACLVTN